LFSSEELIEAHEIKRRLRKIESYPTRVLATLLIQAKCYDAAVRSQFEDEARRLVAKLAGDNEGLFSLLKVAVGAHSGAYMLGHHDSKVERTKHSRDKKIQDKQIRDLTLAAALEGAMKKVKSKPARSDAYALALRPYVLEKLGVAPEKPGERQVWPSVWVIKNKVPPRAKG
jgi:hypothetical protein